MKINQTEQKIVIIKCVLQQNRMERNGMERNRTLDFTHVASVQQLMQRDIFAYNNLYAYFKYA